jgi:uncharacterized protein
MGQAPTGFGLALCALDLHLGPAREIAVVGDAGNPATHELVRAVMAERWLPNVVVAAGAPGAEAAEIVPLLHDRDAADGRPTAYVCEHFACRLPVTDVQDLVAQLTQPSPGADPAAGSMRS